MMTRSIAASVALGMLTAAGTPTRAEAATTSGGSDSLSLEVESQVPCFFFGGYHLALGVRRDRLRLRASVTNSGRLDYEPFGVDNQKSRFERSFDDGSVGVFADYFLTDRWYVGALLASNRAGT